MTALPQRSLLARLAAGLRARTTTLAEALVDGFADVRSHPGRTALQGVGVLLGVGSIVASFTIVDANRTASLKFYEKFGGLRKILVRPLPVRSMSQTAAERATRGLTMSDVERLEEEGTAFDLVDPIVAGDWLVRRGAWSRSEWVQGIGPGFVEVYDAHVREGRFVTQRDMQEASRVVVLGDTAARRLFGGEDPIGEVVDIGGQGFEVVGVLERKVHEFGGGHGNSLEWMNRWILVPLTAVTVRLKGDPLGRVDYMNVMAHSADDVDRAVAEVERILFRQHGGVRDFEVVNRRERMEQRNQQMMAFNVTFIVSGLVSLIVGGVVIMNILLASFRARVREVGVRKALGATGLHVFVQFLVESVVITGLAGAAGIGLGKLFSLGVMSLTGTPSEVSARTIVIALVIAVFTGVVFGLYPAWRAARLPPVEALRYE